MSERHGRAVEVQRSYVGPVYRLSCWKPLVFIPLYEARAVLICV